MPCFAVFLEQNALEMANFGLKCLVLQCFTGKMPWKSLEMANSLSGSSHLGVQGVSEAPEGCDGRSSPVSGSPCEALEGYDGRSGRGLPAPGIWKTRAKKIELGAPSWGPPHKRRRVGRDKLSPRGALGNSEHWKMRERAAFGPRPGDPLTISHFGPPDSKRRRVGRSLEGVSSKRSCQAVEMPLPAHNTRKCGKERHLGPIPGKATFWRGALASFSEAK